MVGLQLLQPLDRAVGPPGEGGADLRLQRPVAGKELRRAIGLTVRVELLGVRERACLGVGADVEVECERRVAPARLCDRRPGGARASASVGTLKWRGGGGCPARGFAIAGTWPRVASPPATTTPDATTAASATSEKTRPCELTRRR